MSSTLTASELEREQVSLLPAREALALFNFANVVASNSSTAANILTADSVAFSTAAQSVNVSQY